MRILNCYMADDSKGHFVTAKEAAKHNHRDILCCVSCGCPLTLKRGNHGQPPWLEHDQMTVVVKILPRYTWLDSAEKEARRLYLQGVTAPDCTVKVRKWFCVMYDEDYEGEKCCPRYGTGVYSRAWGRQEVSSEDARADNPLQRLQWLPPAQFVVMPFPEMDCQHGDRGA